MAADADLFWHLMGLLPVGIAAFGLKFLRDMSISVNLLNTNIAVLVSRVDSHEEKIGDHEERIRKQEHVCPLGVADHG